MEPFQPPSPIPDPNHVAPLVLKPPRRMLQPTKDELRRLLAVERAKVLQLEKDVIFLAMERPVRAFFLSMWRSIRLMVKP